MRVSDHRYTADLDKFDLAVRMIQHEARTGTIRACTGFSEDRIRKIYSAYFKADGGPPVRRRRGKSPKRITQFVNSAPRQSEATVLAGLFLLCEAVEVGSNGRSSALPAPTGSHSASGCARPSRPIAGCTRTRGCRSNGPGICTIRWWRAGNCISPAATSAAGPTCRTLCARLPPLPVLRDEGPPARRAR